MERFLVRNQVPKPDPGIVNRAAKAKKHRKIEKIVDATLYKRKKLETRSAFLHDHEIQEPTIGHTNITGLRGTLHREPGGGAHGNLRTFAVGKAGIPARAGRPGARGRPRVDPVNAVPGRDQERRPYGNVLRVYAPGDEAYGFMEIAGLTVVFQRLRLHAVS